MASGDNLLVSWTPFVFFLSFPFFGCRFLCPPGFYGYINNLIISFFKRKNVQSKKFLFKFQKWLRRE